MNKPYIIPAGSKLFHGSKNQFEKPKCTRQGSASSFWVTPDAAAANTYIKAGLTIKFTKNKNEPIEIYGFNGKINDCYEPIVFFLEKSGYKVLIPQNQNGHSFSAIITKDGIKYPTISDIEAALNEYGYFLNGEPTSIYVKDGTPLKKSDALLGNMYTCTLKEPLFLFDSRKCGDDRSYNDASLFDSAYAAGFDGVIISDTSYQESFGHLEHDGIAIFDNAIHKLSITRCACLNQNFTSFSEMEIFNESFNTTPRSATNLYHEIDPKLVQENLSKDKPFYVGGLSFIFSDEAAGNKEATARTHENKIYYGTKLLGYTPEIQASILRHEISHFICHDLGEELSLKIANIGWFGEIDDTGNIINGINGTFSPVECLTESIAVYQENRFFLKSKYPEIYDLINHYFTFGFISKSHSELIDQLDSEKILESKNKWLQAEKASQALLRMSSKSTSFGHLHDEIIKEWKAIQLSGEVSENAKKLISLNEKPTSSPANDF
ncbi:hypothetical protein ACEUAI_18540 [Aeromonas veronii]